MSPLYLAAGDPQAGPIGLALVVVLAIVVVFLGKSMSRHLSKVPKSFEHANSRTPGDDAGNDPVNGTENDSAATPKSESENTRPHSISDNDHRSGTE